MSESWNDHGSGSWTETDAKWGVERLRDVRQWMGSTNSGNRKIGMNDVGDYIELPPSE